MFFEGRLNAPGVVGVFEAVALPCQRLDDEALASPAGCAGILPVEGGDLCRRGGGTSRRQNDQPEHGRPQQATAGSPVRPDGPGRSNGQGSHGGVETPNGHGIPNGRGCVRDRETPGRGAGWKNAIVHAHHNA